MPLICAKNKIAAVVVSYQSAAENKSLRRQPMRHMWVEEAMILQLCVYLKGMSAQGRCHSLYIIH
jgi:hypothetical protein